MLLMLLPGAIEAIQNYSRKKMRERILSQGAELPGPAGKTGRNDPVLRQRQEIQEMLRKINSDPVRTKVRHFENLRTKFKALRRQGSADKRH